MEWALLHDGQAPKGTGYKKQQGAAGTKHVIGHFSAKLRKVEKDSH